MVAQYRGLFIFCDRTNPPAEVPKDIHSLQDLCGTPHDLLQLSYEDAVRLTSGHWSSKSLTNMRFNWLESWAMELTRRAVLSTGESEKTLLRRYNTFSADHGTDQQKGKRKLVFLEQCRYGDRPELISFAQTSLLSAVMQGKLNFEHINMYYAVFGGAIADLLTEFHEQRRDIWRGNCEWATLDDATRWYQTQHSHQAPKQQHWTESIPATLKWGYRGYSNGDMSWCVRHVD